LAEASGEKEKREEEKKARSKVEAFGPVGCPNGAAGRKNPTGIGPGRAEEREERLLTRATRR